MGWTVEKKDLLDSSKQMECIKEYKNTGDVAMLEKLVLANIPFVNTMAGKYKNKDFHNKILIDDLVSAGIIGIMNAAEDFDIDISNHVNFLTYAKWHIQCQMNREFKKTIFLISIPYQDFKTYDKYMEKMQESFDKTGNYKFINKLKKRKSRHACMKSSSIVYNFGDINFADYIKPDCKRKQISHMTEYKKIDLIEAILQCMKNVLNSREYCIIVSRYGLFETKRMTLANMAEKLNISRERVRQLEIRAIGKIKKSVSKY